MELRSRTEKLAEPRAPSAIPPATKDTAIISRLENDVQMHRFLRSIMCFLAFLIYMLSILQIDSYAGTVIIHVIMLLLSLCAEVCIVFIYIIKARFGGFTDPTTRGQQHQQHQQQSPQAVSVFHSPYLGRMCLEMVLWIVQTPPGVAAGPASNVIDSMIILRGYVFFTFLSLLSSRQVYKRAIGSLCGFRFDSSFVMRYNFLYRSSSPFIFIGFVAMWMCLALLYSKAEEKDFGDSLYFCFSTATLVGFGDFAPRSSTGRICAFFCVCLGLLVLGWFVTIAHQATKLSAPERNMHTLFYTNKLCARVPGEAARVIQRAWKLYAAKKEGRNAASIRFNAFWLTMHAVSFRDLRRRFLAAEMDFLRATATFEDALTALTPASSRAASPATTPRATRRPSDTFGSTAGSRTPRRPFSLTQAIRPKGQRRDSSPSRSGAASLEDMPAAATGPRLLIPQQSSSFIVETQAAVATPQSPAPAAAGPSPAAAALEEHMTSLEEQLDRLLERTQRMARNMATLHSTTELAS